MEEALKGLPTDAVIIGNLDPAGVLRNGTPEEVHTATIELLEKCGKYPNFVVASGCDMPPQTPMVNIETFFNAVNEYYNK